MHAMHKLDAHHKNRVMRVKFFSLFPLLFKWGANSGGRCVASRKRYCPLARKRFSNTCVQ